MAERRRKPRSLRHPLEAVAKLLPKGPAIDRRRKKRGAEAEEAVRERLTVQLPPHTIERLRNAVYWTPGLTITAFISHCISDSIDKLEQQRGGAFPRREHDLKPGRPRKD